MTRKFAVALFLPVAFLLLSVGAPAQTGKTKTPPKDAAPKTLPVEGYELPLDVSSWDKAFQVVKITYDKDANEVIFLLKTKDDYAAKQQTTFGFFDEDDVNLVKKPNVKFEPALNTLIKGESTRCHLSLPDEEILKKTKKVTAR
jgi:hypothetical protein